MAGYQFLADAFGVRVLYGGNTYAFGYEHIKDGKDLLFKSPEGVTLETSHGRRVWLPEPEREKYEEAIEAMIEAQIEESAF